MIWSEKWHSLNCIFVCEVIVFLVEAHLSQLCLCVDIELTSDSLVHYSLCKCTSHSFFSLLLIFVDSLLLCYFGPWYIFQTVISCTRLDFKSIYYLFWITKRLWKLCETLKYPLRWCFIIKMKLWAQPWLPGLLSFSPISMYLILKHVNLKPNQTVDHPKQCHQINLFSFYQCFNSSIIPCILNCFLYLKLANSFNH